MNLDGHLSLKEVFLENFLEAKIQRLQVQVAKNVMGKVPHNLSFFSFTYKTILDCFKYNDGP